MFWVSVHEQGCISRPFSVCFDGVFPALTSAPTVYWMLYFRKPFPGLESLCPSGAGSLCQLLGQGNQLFIGSLQSNTCCIPTIPKGFSHIIPPALLGLCCFLEALICTWAEIIHGEKSGGWEWIKYHVLWLYLLKIGRAHV